MPEGLSTAEVGKEIAEHHGHAEHAVAEHARRERWVSIAEAIMLSIVALIAAWSGYSAAKWSTESSLSLARASATRNKANLATVQATQIRTLDSVSFNAAEAAYLSGNAALFRLSLNRMRPGYRPASDGEGAAGTADKYVRLTVLLAAVLFLVGIGSRFPVRVARYGLNVVACVLLVVSVIELLGLPGPPH